MGSKARYRWRSQLRGRLPEALVNVGFATKGGGDCRDHEWQPAGENVDDCIHCHAQRLRLDGCDHHWYRKDLTTEACGRCDATRLVPAPVVPRW